MPRSWAVPSALILLAISVHWAQAQEPSNQRDILWTAAPAGFDEAYLRIWRMGPDGSNPRPVGGEEGVPGNFAVWSPDGTRIIFLSEREGRRGAFVMAADGTGIQPVGPEQARLQSGPQTAGRSSFPPPDRQAWTCTSWMLTAPTSGN